MGIQRVWKGNKTPRKRLTVSLMLRTRSVTTISDKYEHPLDGHPRPKSADVEITQGPNFTKEGNTDTIKYTTNSRQLLETLLGSSVTDERNGITFEVNKKHGRTFHSTKKRNISKGRVKRLREREDHSKMKDGTGKSSILPEKNPSNGQVEKKSNPSSLFGSVDSESVESKMGQDECIVERKSPLKGSPRPQADLGDASECGAFVRDGSWKSKRDQTGGKKETTSMLDFIRNDVQPGELAKKKAASREGNLEVYEENPERHVESIQEPHGELESTYDEIIRVLETIDDVDEAECNWPTTGKESPLFRELVANPSNPTEVICNLNNVYSLLDAMDKESEAVIATAMDDHSTTCDRSTLLSPRLEQLMEENPVALAHEILTLKIQIEDQKKGINLLRKALLEMKEKTELANANHQEALRKANAEAETSIRRHQKFIEQLLQEKKELNETITKLVDDLKSQEEKFKRNVKALEDKCHVDIKRAKEAQAVADKIKREKWMEMKTKKIKEMTVKGLEPELSRMAIQQQQELEELKNLQRAELEAVELRATRRASQMMDDLRAELLNDKVAAIERETANLKSRMEKEFDEERSRLEGTLQRLKEEIRKRDERMVSFDAEFRQRLMEVKREAEEDKERLNREFKEKSEEMRLRHAAEIKRIRETTEQEKDHWATAYSKQESEKFRQMKSELQEQFKRERDRDIELVINALEKESNQLQLEMNEASENKLKRLREKLEKEIREAEANETALRNKLADIKSQLTAKEELIVELNGQIRCHQAQVESQKKLCEEMTLERSNLKEIVRKEFEKTISDIEKDKQALHKEILALKETQMKELALRDEINAREKVEMQKELAKVYNRIKAVANKKEMVIESLRKENDARTQRCFHLESLLENQRKNLLLH